MADRLGGRQQGFERVLNRDVLFQQPTDLGDDLIGAQAVIHFNSETVFHRRHALDQPARLRRQFRDRVICREHQPNVCAGIRTDVLERLFAGHLRFASAKAILNFPRDTIRSYQSRSIRGDGGRGAGEARETIRLRGVEARLRKKRGHKQPLARPQPVRVTGAIAAGSGSSGTSSSGALPSSSAGCAGSCRLPRGAIPDSFHLSKSSLCTLKNRASCHFARRKPDI